MSTLVEKRCIPCNGDVPSLDLAAAAKLLEQVGPDWKLAEEGRAIVAQFEFRNYFRTLAFVNAVAYIAIREDHHPDMTFGYNRCRIRYSTHAANGLTENDFICAAKIDALRDPPPA